MTNPFAKAAKPYTPGTSPEFAEASNQAKAEALRRAIRAGLLGFAGGAGLTSLLSLPGASRGPRVPSYAPQTDIDLLYPQPVAKTAGVAPDLLPNALGGGALGAVLGRRRAADPVDGALFGGSVGAAEGAAGAAGEAAGQLAGARVGRGLAGLVPDRTLFSRALKGGGKVSVGLKGVAAKVPEIAGGLTGLIAGTRLARKPAERFAGGRPKPKVKKETPAEKKADLARSAVNALGPTSAGRPAPSMGSLGWLRGDTQTDPDAVPWSTPATMLAGVGGLAGGSALVNYLLKKRRKAGLADELDQAQKEYDEAMLAQYDPDKLRNLSAVKGASALDACFDVLEKAAFSLDETAGKGTGYYMTLAALLGLGSGVGTYNWLQSRGGEKTLTDALKRRALIRNMQNPPEMHVRPTPVEYVTGDKDS